MCWFGPRCLLSSLQNSILSLLVTWGCYMLDPHMWHIRFTWELWFTPSLRSIDIIVIVMWESTSANMLFLMIRNVLVQLTLPLIFPSEFHLYWYLVVWSCYLNIYLFWWRANDIRDHENNLKKEPDPIRKACHHWWLIAQGNVLNWTLLEYRLNWPAVIHALSGTCTLAILWLG